MDWPDRIVRSRRPPIAREPTAGRLEEKTVWSNAPLATVKGMVAESGDVSTNEPLAAALASPTISADTGVDALRPVTPRLNTSAAPVHVVSEVQVTVPDTMASEPVKLSVKPVTEKGVEGAADAVNEEIVPAEAVIVPNSMHAKTVPAHV
jgi:hypothetical protein